MIKLIKAGDTNSEAEKYDNSFKLVKDKQPLGFGTINKDKENRVFIFINKEHRGNGYGKILFSRMLEETKKIGYDEVKITFSKENIPMMKIADDNGGKKTSSDADSVKYVFSLK